MSAAAGRGKCPNQSHNPGSQSHNQKRTIHLLLNRTSLLALNRSASMGLPPWPAAEVPAVGIVRGAIPSTPIDLIGRTKRKIHLRRRSSEGHGVVHPAFAGEVGGQREQPRPRKDLTGPVTLIERDPDREAAIGSEAAGDRDQSHRHATPLQPLLGRQHLVGAPEDEDHVRVRRAGQFHSFVFRISVWYHRIPFIMPG